MYEEETKKSKKIPITYIKFDEENNKVSPLETFHKFDEETITKEHVKSFSRDNIN